MGNGLADHDRSMLAQGNGPTTARTRYTSGMLEHVTMGTRDGLECPGRFSRRTFLQAAAVASVAGPRLLDAADGVRVVVVGAGAFGGWTALHLLRRGVDVTLLDAWGPGNSRSSSGGETRVIRAIYGPDRVYVEMVKRAFDLWADLDSDLKTGRDEPLYVETGALWLIRRDDDSYIRSSLPILEDLGFPVDRPGLTEARRRWPQIDFDGVRAVYLERRAGALSARRACRVVADRFVVEGGRYRTARAEPGAIENGKLSALRLDDGSTLGADVYVFACGPWLGQVFPEVIGAAVQPSRQEVYYFGTPPGDGAYGPERLPVWIDFGERLFYGIPDVHGRGFKVADDTRGAPVDPSRLERMPTPEALERTRRFLGMRFPGMAGAPLVESRVCQYENSPEGDLILDRHPEAANVWLAGGGSGHGFKLSPTVGELLAGAILDDRPVPERFGLERLHGARDRSTQFDR